MKETKVYHCNASQSDQVIKSQVPLGGQTAVECFPTPRIIQGIQLDDLSDARETREGFRTFPSEYSHATLVSTARRGRDH